jgi:hypothetical protein
MWSASLCFITSALILDRQLTNNQLRFKEMLTNITSVGTVNPKCDIKWLRPHFQEVLLQDNLVSFASGYEAFAVTREDPFYPRLTTLHSIILSGNTPDHIRCKMFPGHAPETDGDLFRYTLRKIKSSMTNQSRILLVTWSLVIWGRFWQWPIYLRIS